HAVSFDAAVLDVASPVSAACTVAAGYIVYAGIYDDAGSFVLAAFVNNCCLLSFCCYSILLLREDLSRNLELTESKPSLGEDCWELSKTTKYHFCCLSCSFLLTALSGNVMAHKIISAISHDEKEELKKKGIKSPPKLFSLKYLSPASIKELNKNPSALKRVHFVNLIVILNTDSDTEEDDTSSTNEHKHGLDDMIRRSEGMKEQGKEDDGIETDIEVEEATEEEESEFITNKEVKEVFKEEEEDEYDESFNSFPTMKELSHHKWLLKHPRPLWVKAKVRAGSPNNIKISCMIDHIFKRHAYVDLESPVNIMSRKSEAYKSFHQKLHLRMRLHDIRRYQ
ncbi:hypothetical protein Tco_0777537, partial [Tanacetum coccineum]